uniref:Uncharacterized protein n=1 Tax=viral metagenome TaxID=1070528 RepID=A0A6C0HK47_9ZZZZ
MNLNHIGIHSQMNRINRGLIVPHLSKPSQTIMTFDTQIVEWLVLYFMHSG